MKVEDARSGDEERKVSRKQKAEAEAEQSPKKAKTEGDEDGEGNGRSTQDIKAEFEKFCKATREHLTIQQMREILEANGQDASGSDDAVVPRCQDILFYGPLDNCPVCGGMLEVSKTNYKCKGTYSEWSSCTFSTIDPPRVEEPITLPDSVKDSRAADLLRKHQDMKSRPPNSGVPYKDKPFKGLMICLSGRLSRTHQYWKSKIDKHGGKVVNSVLGASCLVVSPAERERGGSNKLAEAMEKGLPVVSEAWLSDSIDKKELMEMEKYDLVSDLTVGGKGIALPNQDESEEAFETMTTELKIFGKRAVHKDTKLQDVGGEILIKDGIMYNCAFSRCDGGKAINEFCIMQLISVPERPLSMYFKKGKIGCEASEERLDEWEDVNKATEEFAKLFKDLTGNEFEQWEREKQIQKKPYRLFPIDIDDGVDVRHGGLGLRQLGVAVAHCKLDSKVANFMKVLCGQEIYKYALMEMGLDFPELPLGMVTDFHLKKSEEALLEFLSRLESNNDTGLMEDALWSDFSQKLFTLLPSTRPFFLRDFSDLADHGAAAFETVRDINIASRLIGDLTGPTLDDPLVDRYKKLGCSILPLEQDTDDYKMISKYLENTYEPVKVGEISYGVSIENIFAVESSACPSMNEIKKLSNKVLLWCGTRSSNLLRHLRDGFVPAPCYLPVPGYMFGKAIVCSDAAAEAARYGFTAVDRPEGFLVLAVAALGERVTEMTEVPPESKMVKELEEKKVGVIGLGRKTTKRSEDLTWKDGIKVPLGKLIASEHKESVLEYNEYAVYDPEQVSIRFLVGVKFEEKDDEEEED